MERLFVYGTLRRGQPLHYLLEGARFLGEGTVRGFTLYDLGEYPAVRPGAEESRVRGEVYEIDPGLFEVLDEVEDEYERRTVPVELSDGRVLEAWMYIYRKPLPENRRLKREEWAG
ncbi:gamma-glutamylcyclotransferase [Thermosulfurimonas sp. F29]|uniref:gamma-glutamylcyclotransferase family protein n=1 Tax=Thermosulfurimonas sp. F29 TaxID=2867247 RepID=UPI001C8334B5|nr:gamma-glutamylcyclotransferase family protein [Thermosulfurimonas sp. F29]MBX6422092.1 gamma-glutamylcyclotransferase [Thermosulfurimonas sp. F29]